MVTREIETPLIIFEKLFWLCVRYPIAGIPLTIFLGGLGYFVFKMVQSARLNEKLRLLNKKQHVMDLMLQLEKLKKRDPDFSELNFHKRVEDGFLKIQNAWSNEDLSPVRCLMSDGAFERFEIKLKQNRANLCVNKITNLQVKDVKIVGIHYGQHFDTLHTEITSSFQVDNINPDTRESVYKEPDPIFTEFWSYLRRPGVKTLKSPGPLEGFCPNCGNPLIITDKLTCSFCQAIITSGEYDWVLAEITQDRVFRDGHEKRIVGIRQMLIKDEAFNTQHMEDRAAVAFWRYHASRFFSDQRYITKLSTTSFKKKYHKQFGQSGSLARTFYMDLAVGAVDLFEVELSKSDDGFDKCKLLVTWSGHKQTKKFNQELVPGPSNSRSFKSELLFLRHTKATSSLKNALSANHCFGCGAPEMLSDTLTCEFCGRSHTDGRGAWVLADIAPFEEFKELSMPVESKKPIIPADDLITAMLSLAMSGGSIGDREKKIIQAVARKNNINQTKLNTLVMRAKTDKEFGIQVRSSRRLKEIMRQLSIICLADGEVSMAERRMLKKLARHHNISYVDINEIIKVERSRLYKKSKAKMKASSRK